MSLYRIKTVAGHNLMEVVSAFQKSVRRGLVDDALYWACDMYLSSYHEYAWKRMKVMVSEDIGLAEPLLPAVIDSLYRTFTDLAKKKDKHQPEKLFFIHAVLLVVNAKKSRMVDHALIHHFMNHAALKREIPDYALDKHTQRGKQMGRGFEHFFAEGAVLKDQALADPYEELAKQTLMGGVELPSNDEELEPVAGAAGNLF